MKLLYLQHVCCWISRKMSQGLTFHINILSVWLTDITFHLIEVLETTPKQA